MFKFSRRPFEKATIRDRDYIYFIQNREEEYWEREETIESKMEH